MFLRVIPIALAAPLILTPTPAQDPPPPAAAIVPSTPSAFEVNAAAQAFRTRIEAMNAEIAAVVAEPGSNRRRAASRIEAILARNQPAIDAFTTMLEMHFAARAAAATTEQARAATLETGAAAVARIRGMPDQVRAGLAQSGPASGSPREPTTPQPSSGY